MSDHGLRLAGFECQLCHYKGLKDNSDIAYILKSVIKHIVEKNHIPLAFVVCLCDFAVAAPFPEVIKAFNAHLVHKGTSHAFQYQAIRRTLSNHTGGQS